MKKKTLKTTKTKLKLNAKHFFKHSKKRASIGKSRSGKSLKFPNIYRIITDKHILVFSISFIIIFAVGVAGFVLYKNINQKQAIDKERQEIAKEVEFWKEIISEYKDYRDAYFQLAVLEYRLGDHGASEFYLEKTFELDPNFEKGRKLEEILKSKN